MPRETEVTFTRLPLSLMAEVKDLSFQRLLHGVFAEVSPSDL